MKYFISFRTNLLRFCLIVIAPYNLGYRLLQRKRQRRASFFFTILQLSWGKGLILHFLNVNCFSDKLTSTFISTMPNALFFQTINYFKQLVIKLEYIWIQNHGMRFFKKELCNQLMQRTLKNLAVKACWNVYAILVDMCFLVILKRFILFSSTGFNFR